MNTQQRKYLLILSFTVLASSIFNFSHAEGSGITFDCTLTDQMSDDNAGEAKTTFAKDTAKIYLSCDTDGLHQRQTIKSAWIAADTNNVAPPNYKIDEKSLQVPTIPKDETYTADFSLSKPTAGWPLGSYHVDLYVDNQLITSVKFAVK